MEVKPSLTTTWTWWEMVQGRRIDASWEVLHKQRIAEFRDTGADVSVLPMAYADIGIPLTRKSVLRDAQGNIMGGGAMPQALIVLEGEDGHQVQLRESFALSNVSEPLLALLRKGWKLEGENDNVRLTHGLFRKRLGFRHNSLVTEAKIRNAKRRSQREKSNKLRVESR